ncbi:MAG: GNAT family N-acetyltransferase [Candidatus Hydrogenedentes bacterium]|nr:GNAT family N-acetyltransferase [Candidatus Hydrogenedentota bacterium]
MSRPNRTSPEHPGTALERVELRKAACGEIFALRHNVLTVGTGRKSSDYPGDTDPSTHHFGAFLDGRNIGCATFLRSEWNHLPAWQLRGMAVEFVFRSSGLGGKLLDFAEDFIRRDSEIHQLWCNARIKAVNFYLRHGWQTESEPFDIPGVGPHVKMSKSLT